MFFIGHSILHFSLVSLVVSLHAKFKVSSSNSSRDMEGSKNSKIRSRHLFPIPFDLILHFFSLVPSVVNLHVRTSKRSRDGEGVPKFEK